MASRASLKAIIDFEGIVVQEEEGFWPKEDQGDRVLRLGTQRVRFQVMFRIIPVILMCTRI